MPLTIGVEWGVKITSISFPWTSLTTCVISVKWRWLKTWYALKSLALSGWCVLSDGFIPEPDEPVLESITTLFDNSFALASGYKDNKAPVGKQPGFATNWAFFICSL